MGSVIVEQLASMNQSNELFHRVKRVPSSHRVINRSNDAAIMLAPPTFDIILLAFPRVDIDMLIPVAVAKVKAANGEAKPTANASSLRIIE